MTIALRFNQRPVRFDGDLTTPLLWYLRDHAQLERHSLVQSSTTHKGLKRRPQLIAHNAELVQQAAHL